MTFGSVTCRRFVLLLRLNDPYAAALKEDVLLLPLSPLLGGIAHHSIIKEMTALFSTLNMICHCWTILIETLILAWDISDNFNNAFLLECKDTG